MERALRTAVMACMRNEAMFVVEWVAYHRLIGFDTIFVCTNDCTDGTDAILDRLAAKGEVIHIRNGEMDGLPPQARGVQRVLAHPETARCDWLLHIDADEFLNIHRGDGHVQDLLAVADGFDAMGISWRLFGDSGMSEWPGGLILEKQVMAEAKQTHFSAMQKTFFRPSRFRSGIDHMPKDPVATDIRLCNARGRALRPDALLLAGESNLRIAAGEEINRKRHFGWDGACINHYAVRTRDLFLLKNVRGDGIGSRFQKRYFLNSRWYRAANVNDVEDRSIQRHLPALRKRLAALRKDLGLLSLERQAQAWFRAARKEHLTPDNVARWTNGPVEEVMIPDLRKAV
ncbi:MAG: glycosyltransferase family 2 protein [Rhodobacteraceae bacterium]|nr:glycosyltransferase family 2 protein [Paracoccaceae bacterium]